MGLKDQFDTAMMEIYHRARTEVGYTPTAFLQMLHKDRGVLTAKKLINAAKVSDGYMRLRSEGRLDLTVEYLVAKNPKWRPLFDPAEIDRASKRLDELR